MFRLAMAQMRVEGGNPAANLQRAADQIAEAARNGAKVVVLPEALDLGWTHRAARTLCHSEARSAAGPSERALARRPLREVVAERRLGYFEAGWRQVARVAL